MRVMRTLGDLGESALIARIERHARRGHRPWVRLGIGDDAAIVRARPGEDLVVSADTLVEDVHFRWETQSASLIGERALAANLSDLAAMGSRPLGCTLALSAPTDLAVSRVDALARGFTRAAERWSCPLVGGNVSRARETSLAVTVFGALPRGRALRRGDVKPGDRIGVTGPLGRCALERLRVERDGGAIRYVPEPRIAAGRAFLATAGHGGCVDLSDGLVTDLPHLLEGSGCGVRLDSDRVPRARGLDAGARRLGLEADTLAFAGGEDYELLLAWRSRGPSTDALSRKLGLAVHEIGRAVALPGIEGWPETLGKRHVWRHFDTPARRSTKARRR